MGAEKQSNTQQNLKNIPVSHDRAARAAAELFTPSPNRRQPCLPVLFLQGLDRAAGSLHFNRVLLWFLARLWDRVPPLEGLSTNLPRPFGHLDIDRERTGAISGGMGNGNQGGYRTVLVGRGREDPGEVFLAI
jgi:hypothetical protein